MGQVCAAMALMLFCYRASGQENPERILQAAVQLHQSGEVERAIPQYRAYLKLRPDAVDARSNLGVALAGGSLAQFIARSPFWARLQTWCSSVVLVGLGLRLAFSQRR